MAMFSVLASIKPTAATVCSKLDSGGGEGGLVRSRVGCERTTEMVPKISAAKAIKGRSDFFMIRSSRLHRDEIAYATVCCDSWL
jgi:hypothetical protein